MKKIDKLILEMLLEDDGECADGECVEPGRKIKSKGKGRGLATGKGKGPIGDPLKEACIALLLGE